MQNTLTTSKMVGVLIIVGGLNGRKDRYISIKYATRKEFSERPYLNKLYVIKKNGELLVYPQK